MTKLIASLEFVQNGFINSAIQALIFEIVLFLSVPIIGIIINSIVVGGIRRIISKVIGRKAEFVFSNYILFFGVVIHELAHALFALITGAKIEQIALFRPQGDSLGYVSYRPRGNTFAKAIQNSLSACAPVIIGIVILSLLVYSIFPIIAATWQWILVIYIFISVLFHMNMSKVDLKCYFAGMLPTILVVLPFSLVYFIFFA